MMVAPLILITRVHLSIWLPTVSPLLFLDVPACGNTAAAQRTVNPGDTTSGRCSRNTHMEYSQ